MVPGEIKPVPIAIGNTFCAKAKATQLIKITNKWMKKIASTLRINTPAITYVPRHSFSTILLINGVTVEFIRHVGSKKLFLEFCFITFVFIILIIDT